MNKQTALTLSNMSRSETTVKSPFNTTSNTLRDKIRLIFSYFLKLKLDLKRIRLIIIFNSVLL